MNDERFYYTLDSNAKHGSFKLSSFGTKVERNKS